MTDSQLLFVILAIPFVAAVLIVMSGSRPNQREGVTLVAAGTLFFCVASLLPGILAGENPTLILAEPISGLALKLVVEPLGMTFALLASLLWIINSLYSIGYMRANQEQHQTFKSKETLMVKWPRMPGLERLRSMARRAILTRTRVLHQGRLSTDTDIPRF